MNQHNVVQTEVGPLRQKRQRETSTERKDGRRAGKREVRCSRVAVAPAAVMRPVIHQP